MKLELSEVAVSFGEVNALVGVSTSFSSGQVSVLAGPNGAGKSTLLGVLLGLVEADRGTLRVDGRVATSTFELRRRLGYLPENVAFAENLTGAQIMRFFGRARGVPSAHIASVLERVGLRAAAKRRVRGYSRGMRQRLGLGVAILADPELLVLDEPTGGLDQQGLELLWAVLGEWRERGRVVVVSTHDLALVERRADTVMILREGAVVASGSPSELRERARLPVRVELGWASAESASIMAQRFTDQKLPDLVQNGSMLEVTVPSDQLATIFKLMNGQSAHISGLRVDEPGLDEVYAELLKGGGE